MLPAGYECGEPGGGVGAAAPARGAAPGLTDVADVPVAADAALFAVAPVVDDAALAIAVVAFGWNIAATSLRARTE